MNEVFWEHCARDFVSLLDFYRERIKKSKTRPTKTTADHNIIISRFFLPGAAGGDRRFRVGFQTYGELA
jgi:hypothetical protein